MNTMKAASEQEGSFDQPAAIAYFHDLWDLRVVEWLPLGGSFGYDYFVTERGVKILEGAEAVPHDRVGFVKTVEARFPGLDPTALDFFREAVDAWAHGLHRSSAVMVGVACERLLEILCLAITNTAPTSPEGTKLSLLLKKQWRPGAVFPLLETYLDSRGLPNDVALLRARYLTAIFGHVRGLRDGSGHPTGIVITGDAARDSLILFPTFVETVTRLIAAL